MISAIINSLKLKERAKMKKFFSTYKQSLILLAAILIGTIAGLVFGERISFLKPLGDLFLNLLLVIIVPLIFLSLNILYKNKRLHFVIMLNCCAVGDRFLFVPQNLKKQLYPGPK